MYAPMPMPPPPMPRWPPLPVGAPPPLRMLTRSHAPFPPLPHAKTAAVQPVNSSHHFSRVWGNGGQQATAKRATVLPYVNAPRPSGFQYQSPTYHQRAVQRQLWDSQSAQREASKVELGCERESETRHPCVVKTTSGSIEKRHNHCLSISTRTQTAATTQRRGPSTSGKAPGRAGESIWTISPQELSEMMQRVVHTKRAMRKLQFQTTKASRSEAKVRTWHHVDDPRQLKAKTWHYIDDLAPPSPEDATSDESSVGDDSSDPEEDAPAPFCRFYALPYMLPSSPCSRAANVEELWDSGIGTNSSIKTPAPPAVQTVDTLNYRTLFALSVDTPSFHPQQQQQPSCAAASSSASKDRDDADLQVVRSKWLLMYHAAALLDNTMAMSIANSLTLYFAALLSRRRVLLHTWTGGR